MNATLLHPDRLFPSDTKTRDVARELYDVVKNAPILSPHGHTDPSWFSENQSFGDPVSLLITPDHYVLRMLYSQGISLEEMGVATKTGECEKDKRKIWKKFAQNFYLFRGTPSDLWLRHVFHEVFGLDRALTVENADYYFDEMSAKLNTKEFLPRSLFERFRIEVLATTDAATDNLSHHDKIRKEWGKRVLPTYRPDGVIDPEHEDFRYNLQKFADVANEDAFTWKGYLRAHRNRRAFFKSMGATATDHGHPTARTLKLSESDGEKLFNRIVTGVVSPAEGETFRAHMLWKLAEMSEDDGLVMQLHPGSFRNYNPKIFETFGRDKGADIPGIIEYSHSLKPLLDSFGNSKNFKMILFTLDETNYARELAPLAGHYPALRLGPAWWFHDSPEGMIRQRKQTMETAGFYNQTGFIDDTRAFFSIPARHDVARRIDARILAELVSEHRLSKDEAIATITDLNGRIARESFRL
ncbi:MAG: glucuronate isomerase [Bdellovibrionota bacterium]